MKKLLTIALMSAITITAFTGCAANSPGSRNNDTFGILSTDEGNSAQFSRMQKNFMGFLKGLNLSEAQKTQFKALKDSMKEEFNNKESKRDDLKNTLKEAFLSSSIDKSVLKAKLLSLKPENEAHISLMANNLIKAYNILTPEQREKIETKMNEIEKKIGGFTNNPIAKAFHGGSEERIDKLSENLNLTDSQKESFKTLFNDGMPDRKEMFEKAGKIKTAIQAELKSTNPSADKIKEIFKGAKVGMEANLDKRLDKLAKVHDLLTAEQRQKLVETIEKGHNKMKEKMKSRFNHGKSKFNF